MSSATPEDGEVMIVCVALGESPAFDDAFFGGVGVCGFGGGVQSTAVCSGPYNHVTSESLSLDREAGVSIAINVKHEGRFARKKACWMQDSR